MEYADHNNYILTFEQDPSLEQNWLHEGTKEIPGYLVECTDGNTYLLFAPDLSSLPHIFAYWRVLKMVKKRFSDHEYEPIRDCIYPAFTSEFNEYGDHDILYGPVENIGKIFKLVKKEKLDEEVY